MNHWEDLKRRVHFMLRELRMQNRNPTGYVLEISPQKLANVLTDMDGLAAWHIENGNGRTILGFSFRITGMDERLALVHEVIG